MLLLRITLLGALLCAGLLAQRPNVVLIITDDQGYGDVGAHGNTMIRTPNLDRLHGESVRLTDYHVDPTCSPSRSALMSGRYSTRTGVWHTIQGRSLMNTREVTMAETLSAAGYSTAMFGKWHLGDNYPLRPQDQGFGHVFRHGGGGVWQTPDYWGNDYFDDTYFRSHGGQEVPEKTTGYCTDVWFDNAIAFIENNKEGPFFTYIATNAPHGPYWVDDKYSQPYKDTGVPETMANFYGMITNIDENVGRLRKKLDEWDIAENTLFIFTTDNGSAAGWRARDDEEGKWRGFNAGMRAGKGSEYDGGHRVPFFVRWPKGGVEGGRDVDTLAAHVDILPTIAELTGTTLPNRAMLDGTSLAPELRGESHQRDRTLFVHSQRVPEVIKWRKSSVMTERWRLINGEELYDMLADPGQKSDVAAGNTGTVEKLRAAYEGWWASLSPVFDETVHIGIGSDAEPETRLTGHDWRVDSNDITTPWNQGHIKNGTMTNGLWAIDVTESGKYEFELRRWPRPHGGPLEATEARLEIAGKSLKKGTKANDSAASFKAELPRGRTTLQTWLTTPEGKERGAYYVYVKRIP